MTGPGRRTFLASAAAGSAGFLAGCQFMSTEAIAEAGNDEWKLARGAKGNTGASTSGGPSSNATLASKLEMTDGFVDGRQAPLVGSDGVYTVGWEVDPWSYEPVKFALYAYRFDPTEGTVDWRRTVAEGEGQENRNLVREVRASLGDGVVYVSWIGDTEDERWVSQLAALDRSDGTEHWRNTHGSMRLLSAPVAVDDTLYRTADNTIEALDAADGSLKWTSDNYLLYQYGHPAVGEDVVVEYGNGSPETEESTKKLYAFDRESGEKVWDAAVPNVILTDPTIHDGTVFVTEGDSYFRYGLGDPENAAPRHLYAFDASDGSERWSFTYDTDEMEDKYVIGGTSFVTVDADHAYIALGFASAERLLSEDASDEALEQFRSNLYYGPNVFALERGSGEVAWKAQVGEQAQSVHPPIVDDDTLYVTRIRPDGEGHSVHLLDRADGTKKGSFGPIERDAQVGVADGALYAHRRGSISIWRDQ